MTSDPSADRLDLSQLPFRAGHEHRAPNQMAFAPSNEASQIPRPVERDGLVASLCFNSIPQSADTASASPTATSESENSGATDKCPVLARALPEQEALYATTNILPERRFPLRTPYVQLEKNPCPRTVSLSASGKCLS